MKMKKIWVVIAAYNEAKHIAAVVRKTKKYCKNIVVVDDGSKDKTYEAAGKAGAIVLKHVVNLGKGAAVKTGCDYAVKKKADIIVLLDADGQHEPDEIPNFLKEIKGNDVVFGYRKLTKKMPVILRFGNWFINRSTKCIYGIDLKDTQSGYRALTRRTYKKVRWDSTGYAMESEMIANVGKHNLKYIEIPIKTIYSEKYKGTTILDGMRIVFRMMLWRLKR